MLFETESRESQTCWEIECSICMAFFQPFGYLYLNSFLGKKTCLFCNPICGCQASAEMEFGLKSLLAAGLVVPPWWLVVGGWWLKGPLILKHKGPVCLRNR